jgi:hypothetical protein
MWHGGRASVAVASAVWLFAAGCGTAAERRAESGEEAGAWERVPDGPLSPRSGAVVVWTGSEVLVVGGDDRPCPPNADCVVPGNPPPGDGAAYDPAKRVWRRIASPPIPFAWAETAVVGDTVFFLVPGSPRRPESSSRLLAYAPGLDSWRELPRPEAGGSADSSGYRLVAAGERLVAYRGSDEDGQRPDLLFDPTRSQWAALPDDPMSPAFDRHMEWAGDRLALFDHELVPNPGSEQPLLTRAAMLEVGGGQWERLPDSEMLSTAPWLLDGERLVNPRLGGADGGEINNWGRRYPHGGILELTDRRWSALPNGPTDDSFTAGVVGRQTARFDGYRGWMLDLSSGQWREVPRLEEGDSVVGRGSVAAGRDLFVYGGVDWASAGDGQLLGDAWLWRASRQ